MAYVAADGELNSKADAKKNDSKVITIGRFK
jgi:hypothetical protein